MSFKVIVNKKKPGFFTVSVFGSLDSENYMELEKKAGEIIVPTTKVVVLDMTEVSYISSMGISAVIKIKRGIEQYQGRLAITNLQPQVKKVFDIIKAMPTDMIFASIEEADAYLTEIQNKEIEKRRQL